MRRGVLWAFLACGGVWVFWFATTRAFRPTQTLAVIVTTCLVFAYAAAFVNHLILIPRYGRSGRLVG